MIKKDKISYFAKLMLAKSITPFKCVGGRKGFYNGFFRRILGSGLLEARVNEEYYFFLSVRVSKVGYAAVDGLGAWALERVFTTVSSEESLDVVYCFIAISSIQTTLPTGFPMRYTACRYYRFTANLVCLTALLV